ncbi:hypothetical protein DEO72_LG4g133 [Vigna unguiculata]|uniref:Ulp1 protease family n=1 Tax=Vigna unguiculata TaxID=3917 RepID=A0A4D6LME3_VIGUN|nr:hypothetical protein DEO72_LG4g133 [Vigna unguiculata]
MKFYRSITVFGVPNRVVCNINEQILDTNECWGFGPGEKVDNMVVLFGGITMMYFERRRYGHVKRIQFNPLYTTHVLTDSRRMKVKRRQLTLKDYLAYFCSGLILLEDILTADFAHNLELFFGMLMNCSQDDRPKFEVHCDITLIQTNLYDCGIIVLQMMELWDGHKKFDGNTMPNYTNEQLQHIRHQYIWHWILDVDNIHRHEVLQYYDALL